MDVFDLVAKITLDSSEYESGLDEAEKSTTSFGQKIKGGIGKAAKGGAIAVAAIGTAAAGASALFVKGVGDVAQYGDNIDKMSQKMGMSSDAYQEWDAVMQHSGTSMETMKASMKTLANAAETGSDAFDKLGISQEQIANMSQEELFEATITALQGVEDETERTYLAGKTLGRGATELGALLNTSAEDTEKMRKRVHELGGVMSKRAVKAAAQYQDSLQDMQTAMSGVKRNLMAEFLPSVTTIMDGITEIFAGDSDKGIGMITSGVDSLVGKIGQKLPKVMDTMTKLLSSFGTVIAKNLPKLITAAVNFIAKSLPGAISGLLSIAIPAVISLVSSVATALPGMLKSIWTAISTAVTENAGLVKEQGGNLLKSIADGIKGAITQIPGAIGNILTTISGWITGNATSLTEKGSEIFGNIASGISGAISTVATMMGDVLTTIGTWVTDNGADLIAKGSEIFAQVVSGIGTAIGTIYSTLGDIIVNIANWINGDGGAELPAKGAEIWEAIKGGIATALESIGTTLMGLLSGITTWVTTNYDTIAQAGKNILTYIVEGIVAVASDVATGMLSLIGAAITWIVNNKGTILTTGKTIVTYIVNGIITAVATIGKGFVSLVSNIASWIIDHSDEMLALGQNILSWIVAGIRQWISDIKDGFDNTVAKIKEKIDSLDFGAIGLQIIKKIKEAIGKWLSGIGEGLLGLPGKLATYVKNNLSFSGVGHAIAKGIKDGFTGIVGLATKIGEKIQDAIKSATSRVYNADVKIAAKTGYKKGSEDPGLKQAKARYKPYLFNKSTIFGQYQGHDLIAGEAGAEMLLGVNALKGMLFESVQGGMQSMMGQIYNMMSGMQTGGGNSLLEAQILDVLNQYLPGIADRQVVLDTGAIAGAVAPGVNAALGTQVGSRRRYNA